MTELQADRESDMLIAGRLGLEAYCAGMDFGTPIYMIRDDSCFGAVPVPYYTTSLDAALGVYDKRISHLDIRQTQRGAEWRVYVSLWGQPDTGYGRASSLPLAICRAWWSWMDAKEKEREGK